MIIKLKYGNTNTFFLNENCGILIDTDMYGTLPAFYKEIKKRGVDINSIKYVIATHYHPDHMGLISDLMCMGVKLILADYQKDFVHFSDYIFHRLPQSQYNPINENEAVIISCSESRQFFYELGIKGEFIPTYSHSNDGLALILDSGECFVGDLEPVDYVKAYSNNKLLEEDWKIIMSYNPRIVYYGHANEKILR